MQQNDDHWRPGQGRRLRAFIVARWGAEEPVFAAALQELSRMGFAVEDVSLPREESIMGPREDHPRLTSDLAARIYASDVLIAPAQKSSGPRDWVAWSVDLAGICYSIPTLLVDRGDDPKRVDTLLAPLRAAQARCDTARAQPFDIAFAVSRLLQRAPHQAIPDQSSDSRMVYRGPHRSTLGEVMRRHPYRSA
ncbi:MAG: hypothetical protein ABUS48_07385 [Pseudomonadota bacterium]